MTDVFNYLNYFQTLANQHVKIKDFYVMDINEPIMALKDTMKFPALILNSLNGSVTAPHIDNTLDLIKGGYIIIDSIDRIDDFYAEMNILQNTKQIGIDIISRMLYDMQKCELLAAKAIPGFDVKTVNYEMVGPVFDVCFGFNFTFKCLSKLDLTYHESAWDPDKTIEGKDLY